MAPRDLTAERAAHAARLLKRLGVFGSSEQDHEWNMKKVMETLLLARQEALREAARICRSNVYMSNDALDGGNFGGTAFCEYGCGDVIANELDRLTSEGG